MEKLIGRELGQYQILGEIGHGGMAVVYKAYQPTLERYVAIKVLPREFTFDREFVQRFLREARAAARLNHPHVVTIYDVGQANGTYYIAMEYLEGPSLADLLRQQGALSPQQAVQIVSQVASALDYAHQQGFVHRDVKPSNILIGAGGLAKLTDFGIVKATEGTRLTQTGTLLGTPEYMSPEQAKGLGVDRRSDIYSLGVVAYEMLTGQVPFSGETMAVLHAHVYETPDLSTLPRGVGAVMERALAKEPAQRYGSAEAFAQALPAAIGPPAGKQIVTPPMQVVARPGAMRPRAHPVPVWVWGLSGIVLLVLLVGCLIGTSNVFSQIWGNGQTSVPHTPAVAAPTSTPWVIVATATPAPTLTRVPPTARPTSPTPDPRIPAREVVERFQDARMTAYSTWDTDQYYSVLAGNALESALRTITQLRNADCRYYISADREISFRYEEVSGDRVVVIASRSETQRRVCAGSTSYTCYAFDGRYVVERRGDQWLITEKSVQNLTETSPCP